MKKPNDPLRLRHILDAIGRIGSHLEGFEIGSFQIDLKTQDAVVRQLEIIGEAATNLTAELREANPQVAWRSATAARNRLIHGYFDVDPELVWQIVENDLPILRSQVEAILKELA
ncbi:MAG: DUF86 domain-containing protein [Acidobacteria bacterium]|nr:DUF86 domain-containing protein [Acidobacteriota bacterium]